MAGNCISKSKRVVFEETLPGKTFHVRCEESLVRRSCRQRSESQRLLLKVWREATKTTWISRESPEGGCVIINDTSSQTRLLEEILKQKRTVTSYEGYLVNEEDNLDPGVMTDNQSNRRKSVESFPIEIVDLPAEPDGKQIDIHFVKEGNIDDATQASVRPEDIDCGVSIRSITSDKQQWSFSLYNFEDHGRISKEDLTNLVKSIYDALGKSVDKANKKNSYDGVKKVKVHVSLSKEKSSREMRGATVVPRREVVVGAEDSTTEAEKQLGRLKLRDSLSNQEAKKLKRRKDGCSTVQVLNNDLSNSRLPSAKKCKCCVSLRENRKKSSGQLEKNSNLLADKPNFPARAKTEPGGCFTPEQKLNPELAQLTEKNLKSRSQRRPRRRSTSPGGHLPGFVSPVGRISPAVHSSGNHSPVGQLSGYNSPVSIDTRKDVPLDPSYAYHAEENKYVYVHAMPRKTPFDEHKQARRHKSKHRRPRDGVENPSGVPSYPGTTSIVHRHEHVHHHYHHYGEKR